MGVREGVLDGADSGGVTAEMAEAAGDRPFVIVNALLQDKLDAIREQQQRIVHSRELEAELSSALGDASVAAVDLPEGADVDAEFEALF